MPTFNFEVEEQELKNMEQKWWIEGLIPKGSLVGLVAQSGAGKSTIAEAVLLHIMNKAPFIKHKVEDTDIFIVDQDSQWNGFRMKLLKLQKSFYQKTVTHKLDYAYYENKKINDGSLVKAINSYPKAGVILIDCWHSVADEAFNYNTISSVKPALDKIRSACIGSSDRTIIFTHHLTEHDSGGNKKDFTADDYMSKPNVSDLIMGSSGFVESLDCYFILSSPDKNKMLDNVFLRPLSKRAILDPQEPFILSIEQDNEIIRIHDGGLWFPASKNIDIEISSYFKEVSPNKTGTVKDIRTYFNEKFEKVEIRESLSRLSRSGILTEHHLAHNEGKWELTNIQKTNKEETIDNRDELVISDSPKY